MRNIILAAAVALVPVVSFAQNPEGARGGAVGGAATGAVGGAVVGGPAGAAVGAVGGAVAGAIIGDQTPRFKTYAAQQKVPSYTYREEVRVGAVLPETGVTYREVPAEFGATGSRYTVVNDRTVIVEPRTRRIIQVIE
ncbi:MAG TPA: DUF1236 domain-containing protein [Bosea sp. (in: a-proteobacteria)]